MKKFSVGDQVKSHNPNFIYTVVKVMPRKIDVQVGADQSLRFNNQETRKFWKA
jgi:hypothetical protein